MSKMKGRTKDVIGLFVDGLDVKLAHLSQRGTKVVVQDLRSATLATRMAEHKPAEVGAAAGGDMNVEDVFGSVNAAAVMETAGAAMPSDDNSSVLLSLLASYNSAKYSLSYSLAEPAIYYHVVDHNFGLRGTKLKRRLLEELKNLRERA